MTPSTTETGIVAPGAAYVVSRRIVVEVDGIPRPKGSMRAFLARGRPRVRADNPNVHRWEDLIATLARVQSRGQLMMGPVSVTITIRRQRPGRMPRGRALPTTKPDLDKYVRAVLDALTRTVYWDDGQVVTIAAVKRYCSDGELPGARIVVEEIT